MRPDQFLYQLDRIFKLAVMQDLIAAVVRAAWFGGGLYLICWGTDGIWGWLPDPRNWVWMGVAGVVVVFIGSTIRYRLTRRFVWRLDRAFELDQQVYTAYERVKADPADSAEDPGMAFLLESEAVAGLPDIRRELADKGWQVRKEVESALAVMILLLVVYLSGIGDLSRIDDFYNPGLLPILGKDPTASEIFPGGIPGETEGDPVAGPGGEKQDELTTGGEGLQTDRWQSISDTLRDLGESLCCESSTYDLGDALQDLDLDRAADEFSGLAQQSGQLSANSKETLSDRFLETATRFQEIEEGELSASFAESAGSLLGENPAEMAEDLDGLAELMRALGNLTRNEPLVVEPPADRDQAQLLPPRDLEVLEIDPGEGGEQFTWEPSLPLESESGLDEEVDLWGLSIIDFTTVWQPYELDRNDIDVVSTYFSPR